jgi:hypothetical protein
LMAAFPEFLEECSEHHISGDLFQPQKWGTLPPKTCPSERESDFGLHLQLEALSFERPAGSPAAQSSQFLPGCSPNRSRCTV